MEHLLQLPAYVFVDGGVDAALQEGPVDVGADEDIAVPVVAEPLVVVPVVGIAYGSDKAEMKMRLPGKVFHDAGDLAKGFVLHLEGLSDDIGAVEIPSGGRLVDDDGVWFVERRIGVTRRPWGY